MSAILSSAEFKRLAKPVGDMKSRLPASIGVARLAPSMAPIITEDSRIVRFVFSDASVDRYGDTVDPQGWDTRSFLKNPIALFGHESASVDTVVGKVVNLFIKDDKLYGDIEFATEEVNPVAEKVFKMVKGGFLNAVSVGFIPLQWKQTTDRNRPGGLDFKKQELLEISIVPIPANPNALIELRGVGLASDARIQRMATLFPESEQRDFRAVKKGLFGVAMLAWLLEDLGYITECAEDEAEREGDDSPVPGMLADAMKQLGACLVAMTVEEVTELLGGEDTDVAAEDSDIMLMATALTSKKAHPLATALSRRFLAAQQRTLKPMKQRRLVVESPTMLTMEAAVRLKKQVTEWRKSTDGVLVLEHGMVLREVDVAPQDADEIMPEGGVVPLGTCGMAPDQTCGMKDQAQCAIHNGVTMGLRALNDLAAATRAGRVLSSSNETSLRQAAELISGVLTQVAAQDDPTGGIQEAEFRSRRARHMKLSYQYLEDANAE